MSDITESGDDPTDEAVIPAGSDSGFDGPLASFPADHWQGYVEESNAIINRDRQREKDRRAAEELNTQEELAERERRLAEYDAAADERTAAQAARDLAETRRVADERRDGRRFAWQMAAVLTSVVLAAAGVTIAALAYWAPKAPAPVVVPAPVVTVVAPPPALPPG